jgi:predicted HTH transcriptional regulator
MFDDRLEIQSPGKLPANVTPQNIRREQFARNPNILLTLMEWGYGELLGHGYDKVYRDLHREHYRDPKLEDTGGSFIVTLFAKDVEKSLEVQGRPQTPMELNQRQQRALVYLKSNKKITIATYLKLNPRITPRTALNDLTEMVERGIVQSVGEKKGRHYTLSEIG